MSESRKDIPISSPLKRKASEEKMADAFGELSLFKKQRPDDDDPTPPEKASSLIQNGPMPRFSHLLLAPEERHNVPKTLNQENPILCLRDTFEACVVLDCPRFIDYKMFQVFDEQGTMFNMQLLQKSVSGTIELDVNHSWTKFINDHNLEAGDQILFDKNLDTSVSADFYYILNYFKKSESGEKPIGGSESSRKRIGGAESSKKMGDGAESSKKPGDDAESSKKPSDDAGESVPGFKMPVFKVIYRRVFLETLPDQQQRDETAGSRPFPREATCLTKIVNADEFESQLFFDVYDAIILADNPKLAEIPLGNFPMEFMVYDEGNRPYNMTLSPFEFRGAITGFCLNGWADFHRNNDLSQGDQIAFYKFLDRCVSNSYYYVVLRLPADGDCLNKRNPVRPGSRPLIPESRCFSKELTQYDVGSGKAGLRLEASEARHFVSSSRSLNEPFMVFDEDDRRYDLQLSFLIIRGQGLVCFLDDVGWEFICEDNNLKVGDTVDVHKVLNQSVCNDHYFVIRIKRA